MPLHRLIWATRLRAIYILSRESRRVPATFTAFHLDAPLSLAVSCEAGGLGPGQTGKRSRVGRYQTLLAALWEGTVASRTNSLWDKISWGSCVTWYGCKMPDLCIKAQPEKQNQEEIRRKRFSARNWLTRLWGQVRQIWNPLVKLAGRAAWQSGMGYNCRLQVECLHLPQGSLRLFLRSCNWLGQAHLDYLR